MIFLKRITFNALVIFAFIMLSACTSASTISSEKKTNNQAAASINVRLGIAYLQKNDIKRAKQKLLLALRLAPELPAVWYSMAYFYEKTGNLDKAEQDYLQAVKLAPKNGATQNNYAAFLCRAGHYRQAIQHFMLAVQDPNYLNTATAYTNAARCALKIPDKLLAQQYFAKARKLSPYQPPD